MLTLFQNNISANLDTLNAALMLQMFCRAHNLKTKLGIFFNYAHTKSKWWKDACIDTEQSIFPPVSFKVPQ